MPWRLATRPLGGGGGMVTVVRRYRAPAASPRARPTPTLLSCRMPQPTIGALVAIGTLRKLSWGGEPDAATTSPRSV